MKALAPFAAAMALALGSAVCLAAPGGHGAGGPPAGSPSQAPGFPRDNPSIDRRPAADDIGRRDAEHSQAGAHERSTQSSGSGRSVEEILSSNTKLAGRVHDLTGSEASAACGGFTNLGGCVSAAHVSKNLDIGFTELKTKMTGSSALDLGAAIHELRPDVDSRNEARKARKQADADIGDTGRP